jgi:transcriptional regulator with XRE-family HTH domain
VTERYYRGQLEALGTFIRSQRQLANLSLRQLAEITAISNPYLSQLERGQHAPSLRVLKSIADALNLPTETLLAHAGLSSEPAPSRGVEEAIRVDDRLNAAQKDALIATYRSMTTP